METLYGLLRDGQEALKTAGIVEYELDAWYLLSYVTGIDKTVYLCDKFKTVSEAEARSYRELVGRRSQRIPLQQIMGFQEFMGLSFAVNEHVLIPRQDTEVLVEEAGKLLKSMKETRVLDLCTGSGCIIVSLEHYYGKKGRGAIREAVGADISKEALFVASENAKRNEAEVSFIESDLFENIGGEFELIVSNPPYIRTEEIAALEPEVRDHEPVLALDGREDGLYFYKMISAQAKRYLKSGGYLLFEIGCDQALAVSHILTENGYTEIRVVKDLAGLDRVCAGKRMEE